MKTYHYDINLTESQKKLLFASLNFARKSYENEAHSTGSDAAYEAAQYLDDMIEIFEDQEMEVEL